MFKSLAVLAIVFVAVSAGSAGAARTTGLSAQDANYLQSSISGDRFEVVGGHIALANSSDPVVRAAGQRMIHDHSMSLAKAIALAKRLRVEVPKAPTPSEVWELNFVRQMHGSSFDAAYTTLEVKDHQQDIEEATFEAVHGANGSVKADAKTSLPMLKTHLSIFENAKSSLGL